MVNLDIKDFKKDIFFYSHKFTLHFYLILCLIASVLFCFNNVILVTVKLIFTHHCIFVLKLICNKPRSVSGVM